MNKATLVGYHGRKNLGDDIFLRIASSWLGEHYGIKKIYVAGLKGHVPSYIGDIEIKAFELENFPTARFVWVQTLFYALRSRILLFSAGSIFTSQPFLLIFIILKLIRLFRPSLPIVALGVSIGPFKNSFDSYWCGRLFEIFSSIVLRDKESEIILKKINPKVKTELAYDLALVLKIPVKINFLINNKLIGLCLNKSVLDINNRSDFKKTFLDTLTDAIGTLYRIKKDISVVIFVVCADAKDGDVAVAMEMQTRLAAIQVEAFLNIYNGTCPEEFAENFSKCNSIITSRMHTGILAMMLGVPVLQVAYAKKINDFYRHCELDVENVIQPTDFDGVIIENFLSNALNGKLSLQAGFQRQQLVICGDYVKNKINEAAFNN